jgi:ubiquinone/menaquinone biosynthesis C-methylase UbiE
MSEEYSGTYIHGTHAEEQLRLSRLNNLMNAASLREMALAGGEKILDVGSGLGQFSRAMARAAGPTGKVIGIEKNKQQLNEALRLAREQGEEDLVEMRQGDALSFPLQDHEWNSFDVAHTRFLLEHLNDPLSVVRDMVRAVRPGGRIILEDDDHDVLRLWPEPPGFWNIWHSYMRSYDRLGNDPYIGRRLVSLLHQAGASPKRNTWIFFGSCVGNPTFDLLVDNIIEVLIGAREAILSTGKLELKEFQACMNALQTWRQGPDPAIWFSICWAEGIKSDQ